MDWTNCLWMDLILGQLADDFSLLALVLSSRKVPPPLVNDTQNLTPSAVDVETEHSTDSTKHVPNVATQAQSCAHTSGARRRSVERRLELAE